MTDRRDTVVVTDGGSSAMAVVVVLGLILVLAIGWWFLFGPGTSQPGGSGTDTQQPVPSVTVPEPSV